LLRRSLPCLPRYHEHDVLLVPVLYLGRVLEAVVADEDGATLEQLKDDVGATRLAAQDAAARAEPIPPGRRLASHAVLFDLVVIQHGFRRRRHHARVETSTRQVLRPAH
jgi:hypothetical protein